MAVYKFKIVVEDNDDIYREVEILSGQHFENFHEVVQDAFKFDKKHAASFFVSDDYWRKGQEITLRQEDLELDAEEIKKNVSPKKLMAATKLSKYIDSPRQRFVYVFDPNVKWTFCIELMKILPDNPKEVYPRCVKSMGNAPKQYKQAKVTKGELNPDLALAALLNDTELEENEIYKAIKNDTNGIDEGDLDHLEGEEGEDELKDGMHDDFNNDEEIGEGEDPDYDSYGSEQEDDG